MDRERHLADNKRKYELYFNLLHSKMREHRIEERNTYNIDKKGFFVGIAHRRKRIFSKAVYESKEQGDDWHGGAVFYSPRKLASVRARKAAELDEAPELQLQKARDKERKAAEAAEKKRS
ncbi:hypothetical protein A1F95_08795 [Pyrenophora tritici-repentis]|nr:hypothetical protein A1F95_08795 [Pyrenophora tritici-repentis]